MNLTNENAMRSRYKLDKILSNAWWKGTSPKGQRFLKSEAFEGGKNCREEKLSWFYTFTVISFSGIPKHWIIFYQVKMVFYLI